jgi:kinesin family member 2/24
MQIIDYGMGARVTSQNGTNNDSSRSHAILQISLKIKNRLHGKISFIDLAGSERAADHADQLEKQTRIDGA